MERHLPTSVSSTRLLIADYHSAYAERLKSILVMYSKCQNGMEVRGQYKAPFPERRTGTYRNYLDTATNTKITAHLPGIDPRDKSVTSCIIELCRLPDDLYCFKVLRTKHLADVVKTQSLESCRVVFSATGVLKQLNSSIRTKFKTMIIPVSVRTGGSAQ
jgi:hypothetical protein